MRLPRRPSPTLAALTLAAITLAGCAGATPGAGSTTAGTSAGSAPASLASAATGSLRLSDGWVVATTPMTGSGPSAAASTPMAGMSTGGTGQMSAAYAVIRNTGDTGDALVSVSTPMAGEAQLHTTVENSSGGETMQRVDSIPVPAGGSATLRMGGYHVMLMGLTQPLAEGATVTMTWTFRSGASITTTFPVISREHRPGA